MNVANNIGHISVDIKQYSKEHHAAQISELAENAFLAVPEHERPKDLTPGVVDALLSETNPAGTCPVALATINDTIVGCFSAVPGRLQKADGFLITGFQPAFLWVRQTHQRQGVGIALLTHLTSHLSRIPNSFIYTYPNQRSMGAFLKCGYEKVADIKTYIFPNSPSIFRKGNPGSFSIEKFPGAPWAFTVFGTSELETYLGCVKNTRRSAGFMRDAEYLRWRYGSAEYGEKYQFMFGRNATTNDSLVIVTTAHSFSNIRIFIFSDLISATIEEHLPLAVAAVKKLAGQQGFVFVYIETNLFERCREKQFLDVPLSFAVPRCMHPRPLSLLMYPGTKTITKEELAQAPVMTGDWQGF